MAQSGILYHLPHLIMQAGHWLNPPGILCLQVQIIKQIFGFVSSSTELVPERKTLELMILLYWALPLPDQPNQVIFFNPDKAAIGNMQLVGNPLQII